MQYFDLVTEIFVSIDDFYIQFNQKIQEFQLPAPKKQRNRSSLMSGSEVMTILVLFHLSQHRSLKHFYLYYVKKHMQAEFPKTVSYNRFVELMSSVLLPLTIYLKTCRSGKCSGISFVDSTPLRVCHNKRIGSNKVFADIAQRGKTSMGWFFGFLSSILLSMTREKIINFAFTEANVVTDNPLFQVNSLKKFGENSSVTEAISPKISSKPYLLMAFT